MFAASKSGGGAVPTDPDFEYVTLLLPGNGTNGAQNNTFIDSSTNNYTVTRVGNPTQGTLSPYGSNWSNYFDGTGDYLNIPASSQFTVGTGDFTIECWFKADDNTQNTGVFQYSATAGGFSSSASNQIDVQLYLGNIYYGNNAGFSGLVETGYKVNFWYHIALVRSGTTLKIYLNGVEKASVTDSTNYTGQDVVIGGFYTTAYLLKGFVSNFRFVKGTAVYTSAFTPSTTPLTAITNTSLLTCQSNRFIDNSTNNFTVTRNGNAAVQKFSPFAPATEYSAATYGGSGYFDGNGDYLDIANATDLTPSGDFTIEFWAYPLVGTSVYEWYSKGYGIQIYTNGSYWGIALSSNNNSTYDILNAPTVNAFALNAWQHVALTRTGNTYTFFVNGVVQATSTSTSAPSTGTAVVRLGDWSGGAGFAITGYMAGVRYINGTSQYGTTAFTPPTSPPTAVTNTKLLVNFTNAGIVDNSMMHDIETIGGAQISTAQSKFGGGSIYFDGNGDYLKITPLPQASITPDLQVTSGDWTVEAWVRFEAQTICTLFSRIANSGSGDWSVFYNEGLDIWRVVGTGGTVDQTNTWAPTLNTWYHIAVCRSGSSFYFFVDGVKQGNTVTSTATFSTTATGMAIGAFADGTNPYQGYIDDLRITNGVARYTANFTPPSAPFPTN